MKLQIKSDNQKFKSVVGVEMSMKFAAFCGLKDSSESRVEGSSVLRTLLMTLRIDWNYSDFPAGIFICSIEIISKGSKKRNET